jgi:hypothetical protein
VAAPLILPGGSLVLQLSHTDTASPDLLFRALLNWERTITTWKRQVGEVVNTNQALSTATADRPTAPQLAELPNSGIGYSTFDVTLQRPIWWTGVHWVNSVGTVV